jgi:hypothetical protein
MLLRARVDFQEVCNIFLTIILQGKKSIWQSLAIGIPNRAPGLTQIAGVETLADRSALVQSSGENWLRQGLGGKSRIASVVCWKILVLIIIPITAAALPAKEKDAAQYGAGLIANVPFPEGEVTPIIQDIVQNGIIRGTKEYNKDEYVQGANAAASTRAFKPWTEGGKVFYKVREKALDPQNFKNSTDMGTLAVRYVVQAQDDKHTVIRIDAVFVEDFRHVTHLSNGSVEGAEYKDIHDRLDALELMKTQTTEALQEKQEHLEVTQKDAAQKKVTLEAATPAPPNPQVAAVEPMTEVLPPDSGTEAPPPQSLEERVKDLKQQLERRVKAPGAPLKSAPFHTASVLQTLSSGAEVLIVILTPYWFGVETHEGQHGWMLRDDLEQLP